MLIGAHVSTGGGLDKAVGRGTDLGCASIQIFNQSPRMWRPTKYGPEDFSAFREAAADSPIEATIIHAIYLINPATDDPEMREKAIDSLTHALWVGAGIGADGVVLHPGALKTDKREVALKRACKFIKEALAESEGCDLLLENNAGSGQLLGRDFDELAALIKGAGGGKRLGVCLDSCHLHASGFDISTPEAVAELVDEFDAKVGLKRLRALHINDSRDERGDLRDRHENVGKGKIGAKGMAAFLSEPRFEDLPATLETPGPDKHGADKAEVNRTKRLRKQGLAARAG